MNKKIAFLLSLTLIGTCAVPLSQTNVFNSTAIVASAATPASSFNYSVSGNNATITGYKGTATAVEIPEYINGKKVTKIGNNAFANKSIKSVIIPDSVTSLGSYSFYNCKDLKKVTLSKNLVSSYSGGYLFYLSPVTEVVVNGNMSDPAFVDHFNYHTDAVVTGTIDGLKYSMPINTKKVTITGYSGNGGVVSIPDYILGKPVTTIGESAFNGNKNITEIKFGNNVESLQSYSFNNCTALKTITLGANISTKASGGYLFNGCDALKTINVPYEMKDKDFVFHFKYLDCFAQFIRTETDMRLETVLNELKSDNPSLNWNIRGLQGAERERAKYEVARYIHSRLGNDNKSDNSVYIHYQKSAEDNLPYCLVSGTGTCAGMSSAYALLLLQAGFELNEVDLIGTPGHQLAGIKLFDQWYLVECTNNDPSSFAMHHTTDGWYKPGTTNGVVKIESRDQIYRATGPLYTNYGTAVNVNADTQAYIANKYGRANGGNAPYADEYARGDINMDNSIDAFDITSLRRYFNGTFDSGINLANCDFNHDGKIDTTDLRDLQDFVLNRK